MKGSNGLSPLLIWISPQNSRKYNVKLIEIFKCMLLEMEYG